MPLTNPVVLILSDKPRCTKIPSTNDWPFVTTAGV